MRHRFSHYTVITCLCAEIVAPKNVSGHNPAGLLHTTNGINPNNTKQSISQGINMDTQAFERFKREYGLGDQPIDLDSRNPRFRHYEDLPNRDAINENAGGIDPSTISPSPSAEPSASPSNQPSAEPSVSPSNQPSAEPSASPSNQPSASASPSNQPSTKPSASPSNQPSASASPSNQPFAVADPDKPFPDCSSDENGDFNIDAIGSATLTVVDYKYEIVIDPTLAKLRVDIMPFLEKAILDSILPDIFQCDDNRLLSTILRNGVGIPAFVGASARPTDVVSSKLELDAMFDSYC